HRIREVEGQNDHGTERQVGERLAQVKLRGRYRRDEHRYPFAGEKVEILHGDGVTITRRRGESDEKTRVEEHAVSHGCLPAVHRPSRRLPRHPPTPSRLARTVAATAPPRLAGCRLGARSA